MAALFLEREIQIESNNLEQNFEFQFVSLTEKNLN